MSQYTPLELDPYCNATAATYDTDRARGTLNAWGNSFPAEELPFGTVFTLAGVPFLLPSKGEGRHDHLEALSQSITAPEVPPSTGLALLCFGEMGEQEVTLQVYGKDSVGHRLSARAKAWLIPAGLSPGSEGHACSHLHFMGGYELALMRPTLWCCLLRWEEPIGIVRLVLGTNPLFHLMAVTCLHEERHV